MEVGTQCERAILVELLMTSPAHRVSHTFHFYFCLEFQSFEFCPLWQYKLRLSELSRNRVTGVQASTTQHLTVFALDSDSQHSRNTGDSIICETNNQPEIAAILIAPDHRWSHAVTNAT